jgi:hypothetical protein
LFCESCGYDYTTGALPQQELHAELGLTAKGAPAGSVAPGAPGAMPVAPVAAAAGVATPVDDSITDQPTGSRTPPGSQGSKSADATGPSQPGRATGSARAGDKHQTWVAEVWIDPQWYAFQEATDPLPPQGPARIVVLHESALIGRRSVSRNIHPDIDCGIDPGVSRRQAYLSSADGYWYVTDLESANGTFVGAVTDPLPDEPIAARTPVGPDVRIYVGAWTRIVVRPAIAEDLPVRL